MTVRSVLSGGALTAILLAGCGGSSGKGTTSSSSASAPPGLSGVQGRVLVAGELAGFKPAGNRTLGINAESWAAEEGGSASQQSSEAKRYTGLGFVAAVSEHVQPTNGDHRQA